MTRILLILLTLILIFSIQTNCQETKRHVISPEEFREHVFLIIQNKKIFNKVLNGDTAIFINVKNYQEFQSQNFYTVNNIKIFFWMPESLFFYGVDKNLKLVDCKYSPPFTFYEFVTFSKMKELFINVKVKNKIEKDLIPCIIDDMKISNVKKRL